jgi:endonuclease/exonuclease/phosphatase family metal-dependent hydrolase
MARRVIPRLLLLVIAAAMALGCAARVGPPASPPSEPVLFAVVSWNMHVGRGDLARLVDDLTSGRLAGLPVRDYVLLLQEAVEDGPHDVHHFADAHDLMAAFAPVRTHRDRTTGNAIVATRPLDDARPIVLPVERQPRGAIAADLTVAGERLFVVSAHLENRLPLWRGGFFAERARGRQADALLDALPADGPGVIGADLNTMLGPGEPAWRAVAARFPDTPDGMLKPTFRGRLTLDHLFFDLPEGWRAHRTVATDRYGSDHHPVVGLVWGS